MKNRTIATNFILSFSALALVTSTALASSNDIMAPATSVSEIVAEVRPAEEQPSYDSNTNYMHLMIKYTAQGNYEAMRAALAARNEKIIDKQLDEPILTEEEFFANFVTYSGFWCDIDYLGEMVNCCLSGETGKGRAMAVEYNLKLDALESKEARIDFDNLFLLSKIITWEAGSSWIPIEQKMAVGEVLLNRVASPEFPDTLKECVYQKGQYSGSHTAKFQKFLPRQDCVEAALRLLQGERVLNEPKAIFQANFKQGSGVYKTYPDGKNRVTYICLSKRPWLYH